MTVSARKPLATRLAAAWERRDQARLSALRALTDLPNGMGPCAAAGLNIGVLIGLERDGLAERLPERDRIGDLRFQITAAGRTFLEAQQ